MKSNCFVHFLLYSDTCKQVSQSITRLHLKYFNNKTELTLDTQLPKWLGWRKVERKNKLFFVCTSLCVQSSRWQVNLHTDHLSKQISTLNELKDNFLPSCLLYWPGPEQMLIFKPVVHPIQSKWKNSRMSQEAKPWANKVVTWSTGHESLTAIHVEHVAYLHLHLDK